MLSVLFSAPFPIVHNILFAFLTAAEHWAGTFRELFTMMLTSLSWMW